MSTIVIEHELKTTVFSNNSSRTKSTFWGVSSGSYLYSLDEEQTTDVLLMAARKAELEREADKFNQEPEVKVEFETIPVLDLGLYSNIEDNINFKLITEKQIVKPNSIEYFQFRFLISKEILKKFTTMLPADEEIYEANDEYGQDYIPTDAINLLLGKNDDTYSIEDISELRLKLSILLSATASNGEFMFLKYYNYQ